MNKADILLLEDDPIIGEQIKFTLTMNDLNVRWVKTIEDCKSELEKQTPNLAIFDVNIGNESSLDLLKTIQTNKSSLPTVFLSANGSEENVIKALELGANDFIHKPINNKELILRVKTHLRLLGGVETASPDSNLIFEGITLNPTDKCLTYEEIQINLNQRQTELLILFYEYANKVLKREQILQLLIDSGESDIDKRTVDAHISQIRAKLRKSGIRHISIESVYRIGYRLSSHDD
jgi:DNA-binding response OmpR family regulator